MAFLWKKYITIIILFLMFVNGNEIPSSVPLEDTYTCLNDSDGTTISLEELSTVGTTSSETESPTEETEMATAQDEKEEVATTEMISSKDIKRSTTDKPKKPLSTTTEATVTTSQVPTLSVKTQSWNYTNPFGDFCPCDLTVNSCDINCCCDVKDCSEKDQEVFTECLPLSVASPDPRLCRQYQWISTSNHTLILETFYNNSGFLCIDRDNNPGRFSLQNVQPIKTLEEFNDLIKRRTVFKWPIPKSYDPQINIDSMYKAGDVLWAVKNVTLFPLSFLASGFNTVCQSTKWIRFLDDWESSCTLGIPFMVPEEVGNNSTDIKLYKEKCSRLGTYTIFKDLVLLNSPHLWSNISSNICLPEICISVEQWLCYSRDVNECKKVEFLPSAMLREDVCSNVLLGIQLVVNVVGSSIHSAQVYHFLSNISFSSGIPAISRKHSVSYGWWSNEEEFENVNDKDRTIWQKSGSPGYIVGKPVMAGWKETVVLGGEDFNQRENGIENGILEGIRVTPDPNGWLTVLGNKEGSPECGGPRKAVNFGHSAWWSCSVQLSQNDFTHTGCLNLKKKALTLLLGLGTIGNLSERYIASFGDSSPEKVNEWLPLKTSPSDEKRVKEILNERFDQSAETQVKKVCKELHSSIHIELATALVGSVTNPQAKIVGAVLTLGQEIEVKPHRLWVSWQPEANKSLKMKASLTDSKMTENKSGNNGNSKRFEEDSVYNGKKYLVLVTSVKFIDVTEAPKMEVAPPPVYHIRLPYGFFYPFLSGASSLSKCTTLYLWFFFILNSLR